MALPLYFILLGFLGAPAGLADGVWLPTVGPAAERSVMAISGGGDGAIYAAGAGLVFRLPLGGEWQQLGRYAPQLLWQDGEIIADGPFDPRYLQDVASRIGDQTDDAQYAGGDEFEDESSGAAVLQRIIHEPDPQIDSPFRVGRMVPSSKGVWIGAGGGLFWADESGVDGPIGTLAPIADLAVTSRGLLAVTPQGIHHVKVDGTSTRWISGQIKAVTTLGAQTAYLSRDQLFLVTGEEPPQLLVPPTGQPTAIAGQPDGTLWVATALALFRWTQREGWHLCTPNLPPSERLIAGDDVVISVSERRIDVLPQSCEQTARLFAPALLTLGFTDATVAAGSLWGASTDGVFVRGPRSEQTDALLEREGFRRAVRDIPPVGELLTSIYTHQRIDKRRDSFGLQPLLSTLLPEIDVRYRAVRQRDETPYALVEELLGIDALDRLYTREQDRWWIGLRWNISTQLLGALFGAADESSKGDLILDPLEAQIRQLDGDPLIITTDDPDLVFNLADVDATAKVDQVSNLAEVRYLSALRQKLRTRVLALYGDRQRLTWRLWTQQDDQAALDLVLKIDMIDAELEGLSGGAYTRLRRGGR